MRRLFLLCVVMLGLAVPVRAQSTSISSSGTLPATCTPKQIYYKTGGSAGFYVCTAANTWTLIPTAPVSVTNGGTGTAPGGDDQVFVSSSSSAGAWKTLTDCAGANQAVTYTASSNTWGCVTITGGGGGGVGTVTTTGSPVSPQLAQFSGSTSITGLSAAIQPQGRVTLTTGTPWMTTTATAQTTVYYTPAVGNVVPIYDGTNWGFKTFTELSQATTDSTKSPAAASTYSNYDVFVWSDSGTLRATRGPAWTQAQTFTVTIATPAVFSLTGHGFYECEPIVLTTTGALPTGLSAGTTYFVLGTGAGLTANAFEVSTSCGGSAVNTSGTQSGTHTATQHDTIRGTGAGTTELEFVNGILMNKNAITNGPAADRGTYVGTIRTNGSSQVDMIFGGAGAAGGESTVAGIWNMYNRRTVTLVNFDNTDTWNYTTNTARVKDGNVNNRIQYLTGYQGDGIYAINSAQTSDTNSGVAAIAGVGANSMSAFATGSAVGRNDVAGSTVQTTCTGFYGGIAPLGFAYVAPLEQSGATGTRTWDGDGGGTVNVSTFIATVTY